MDANISLRNINLRAKLLLGEAYGLRVEPLPAGGASILMRISE